ncbi:MAG: glutamate--tRNA ligase [Deltaproteobacteria bacterium]|nr:glutamate--tRNA ligase [Deltaproteobacteria bacterium]
METTRVRFAPSPTGELHVGGARTALFNYFVAKKNKGTFILRIDDTDRERSRPELERDICENLRWLGIEWDAGPDNPGSYGSLRQSERLNRHCQAAREMLANNKAYCDEGGALRLKYPTSDIVINDVICGECVFSPKALGPEPVILRQDGTPTYHLASVVDDADMGITHVIRGQDHLTNTAKQVLIFHALEARLPVFAHLPLILGTDGQKLSKRNSEGLAAVSQFRTSGYLPQALVNFLMLLGWSHPQGKEQISIEDAVEAFSLDRVGKTASIFDVPKLDWLNAWWIKHLPVEEISREALQFTAEYRDIILQRGDKYWRDVISTLRDELRSLRDAKVLAKILVAEEFEVSADSRALLTDCDEQAVCSQIAKAWLELIKETATEGDSDCYDAAQFQQLNSMLKKQLGFGGKKLFQVLRIAITGQLSGPELKAIIPFIRRELLIERASQILENF